MERMLVSACLLGEKVRYDGGDKLCDDEILARWSANGRVVALCPELAGGFPTPRPPAEISNGKGGLAVLDGKAKVIEIAGQDVTAKYVAGASAALRKAVELGIRIAVLKEGSPSCGSAHTYDGSFTGRMVAKPGVTAAWLQEHGIFVFNELQLPEAEEKIKALEKDSLI